MSRYLDVSIFPRASSRKTGGRRITRSRPVVGLGRRRHHRGKGIFDDIWSGIKQVASNPLVKKLGATALNHVLGGRRKRVVHRRKRVGGSVRFLLPRLQSVGIGGRRKRRTTVGARRKRGRGGIGSFLGSLLPF